MIRVHFDLVVLEIVLCIALCSAPFAESATAQTTSGAQVQNITPDARSQGMGRAFVALADGPNTVWWNPAALGVLDRVSVSPFSRAQLVPDLANDVWIHTYSAAAPVGKVGVGLHHSNLDYGESRAEGGTFHPKESGTILGIGRDFAGKLWPNRTNLDAAVGVGLKYFDLDLAPRFATPNGRPGTGSGWDVDLGMLLGYEIPFATGGNGTPDSYVRSRGTFVLRNVFDRNVKLDDQDETDPLVRRQVWGLGVEAALVGLARVGHVLKVRTELDRFSTDYPDDEPIRHMGAEASILNMVFVRRGFIDDERGDIEGTTKGWGLGFDFDFSDRDGRVERFGARYDRATVPQASSLDDVTHESATIWISLR